MQAKHHLIAVVLAAAMCFSMAAPMDAEAVTFLAAAPALWAAAAGVLSIVAVSQGNKTQKEAQVASNVNTPTAKPSSHGSVAHVSKASIAR